MENFKREEKRVGARSPVRSAKGLALAVALAVGGNVSSHAGILFRDDFERESVGDEWRTASGAFAIADGAMKGGMHDSDTHPAIAKISRARKRFCRSNGRPSCD